MSKHAWNSNPNSSQKTPNPRLSSQRAPLPDSQLTSATHGAIRPNPSLHRRLLMLLRDQGAPIELLITGRDIERGILIEEIDRLQLHLNNLTRHDGEILHPRHMLQPELHPHDDILIHDRLLAVRPRAHARPAARLVRVLAAGVEFAVAVPRDVDVVVCELGALVVEGVRVGEHFLEGRGVDFIADGFAVDGVAGGLVEDLEAAARVVVSVEAGGRRDGGFRDGVADAVGVEVGDGHGVDFVVDEAVGVAVDGGVDA